MKIQMQYSKSTKGTHVYVEVDGHGDEPKYQDARIPTLYIRRGALPTDPPVLLTLEVTGSGVQ